MPNKGKTAEPVSATMALAGPPKMENIWVRKLRGPRYENLTVPFFAYNLSLGDIVECRPDEDGIGLFIEKVLKKSGNRTVRVGFVGEGYLDHPEGVKLRKYLRKHGLRYEIFKPALLAINVPPDFDYDALAARLNAVPKDAGMEWEDGDPQPNRNLDGSRVKGGKKA